MTGRLARVGLLLGACAMCALSSPAAGQRRDTTGSAGIRVRKDAPRTTRTRPRTTTDTSAGATVRATDSLSAARPADSTAAGALRTTDSTAVARPADSTAAMPSAAPAMPDSMRSGAAPSAAMPSPTMAMPPTGATAWTSAAVLTHLATGDSLEVEWARIAQRGARSPAVRTFAQTLITDHQAHLQQTRTAAQGTSVAMQPAAGDTSAMHAQSEMARLGTMQGAALDSTFLQQQIAHHRADIDLLTQLRTSTTDAAVQQLIDQTLPVLRRHLAEAERLSSNKAGAGGP